MVQAVRAVLLGLVCLCLAVGAAADEATKKLRVAFVPLPIKTHVDAVGPLVDYFTEAYGTKYNVSCLAPEHLLPACTGDPAAVNLTALPAPRSFQPGNATLEDMAANLTDPLHVGKENVSAAEDLFRRMNTATFSGLVETFGAPNDTSWTRPELVVCDYASAGCIDFCEAARIVHAVVLVSRTRVMAAAAALSGPAAAMGVPVWEPPSVPPLLHNTSSFARRMVRPIERALHRYRARSAASRARNAVTRNALGLRPAPSVVGPLPGLNPLVLVTSAPGVEVVTSTAPNVIDVGPLLPVAPKPVPPEPKNSSTYPSEFFTADVIPLGWRLAGRTKGFHDGVLLITAGAKTPMTAGELDSLISSLAELEFGKFVWKLPEKYWPVLPRPWPRNTIIVPDVDEEAVLRHNLTWGLIAHGSSEDVVQALAHDVALLALPVGPDHAVNAQLVQNKGWGVNLRRPDGTLHWEDIAEKIKGFNRNKTATAIVREKVRRTLRASGGTRRAAELLALEADLGGDYFTPAFPATPWWDRIEADIVAAWVVMAGVLGVVARAALRRGLAFAVGRRKQKRS
ncbi:unnamed protein product [Pedinophyceae sp. YPF-701]|nr:unnamed protein product [Pedinophyceae sp. YPF-701]